MAKTALETADGSYTLHSERYQQTYHSVHGARTESEHVFLEGSGVLAKLQDPLASQPIRILEVGLGLGVNALVTAEAAARFGTSVDYVGIEHDFQSSELIGKVLRPFDKDASIRFCNAVSQLDNQTLVSEPTSLNDFFSLQIIPTDLNTALGSDAIHAVTQPRGFDAIYLDAFSPDANPECWTFDVLKNLSHTLVLGGNLATYCAKGSVRRALEATGLQVTRRPGPPGKRECLVARA